MFMVWSYCYHRDASVYVIAFHYIRRLNKRSIFYLFYISSFRCLNYARLGYMKKELLLERLKKMKRAQLESIKNNLLEWGLSQDAYNVLLQDLESREIDNV